MIGNQHNRLVVQPRRTRLRFGLLRAQDRSQEGYRNYNFIRV
jgi:hypothetical protein